MNRFKEWGKNGISAALLLLPNDRPYRLSANMYVSTLYQDCKWSIFSALLEHEGQSKKNILSRKAISSLFMPHLVKLLMFYAIKIQFIFLFMLNNSKWRGRANWHRNRFNRN
jgi:hypothetical protein